jgi:hypothetical protein
MPPPPTQLHPSGTGTSYFTPSRGPQPFLPTASRPQSVAPASRPCSFFLLTLPRELSLFFIYLSLSLSLITKRPAYILLERDGSSRIPIPPPTPPPAFFALPRRGPTPTLTNTARTYSTTNPTFRPASATARYHHPPRPTSPRLPQRPQAQSTTTSNHPVARPHWQAGFVAQPTPMLPTPPSNNDPRAFSNYPRDSNGLRR